MSQCGNYKHTQTPLIALSSDEIVKASPLRPTAEEHRTSPTSEEEAALLGEVEPPQVPEHLEVHEPVHPAEQITAPAASSPSPPSQPNHLPSQKVKKSQQGIEANTTSAGQWVCVYLEENEQGAQMVEGVLMYIYSTLRTGALVTLQSKHWATNKPWLSGCPQHRKRRMTGGPAHPVWRYWGGGTTFPQRISTEPMTTGK